MGLLKLVVLQLLVISFSAIQQEMGAIEWDNPPKALLSLANIVEHNMGGTSGAVSSKFITLYSYQYIGIGHLHIGPG